MSLRRSVHNVGIGGVDEHPTDPSGVLEPHARPVLSGIGGTVDPVADGDVAAQEGLTGPEPHHVRIARGHRDRADRGHAQRIGDRDPADAAVGALEQAATRGARVVRLVLAGNAGHRDHAVAVGADETPRRNIDEGRVERSDDRRGRCRHRRRTLGARRRGRHQQHGGEEEGQAGRVHGVGGGWSRGATATRRWRIAGRQARRAEHGAGGKRAPRDGMDAVRVPIAAASK